MLRLLSFRFIGYDSIGSLRLLLDRHISGLPVVTRPDPGTVISGGK